MKTRILALALSIVTGAACHHATRIERPRPVPFEKDGIWGYRSEDGRVVIEPRYDVAQPFSENGIAAVADSGGWSYIDPTGRTVVRPYVYDNGPDPFGEGLARCVVGGKVGFFDERGRVVIEPQFDFASPFHEGLAAVCNGCREIKEDEHRRVEGGTWGYINPTGNIVIPLEFDSASDFEGGRAIVSTTGRKLTIDRSGKPVE